MTGGTDMGLMLVDLTSAGVTGDVAAKALEAAGLAVNKNMIPFDPRPPEAPSGLRLSSNAGTTRGFGVAGIRADRRVDRTHPASTRTIAGNRRGAQEVLALAALFLFTSAKGISDCGGHVCDPMTGTLSARFVHSLATVDAAAWDACANPRRDGSDGA